MSHQLSNSMTSSDKICSETDSLTQILNNNKLIFSTVISSSSYRRMNVTCLPEMFLIGCFHLGYFSNIESEIKELVECKVQLSYPAGQLPVHAALRPKNKTGSRNCFLKLQAKVINGKKDKILSPGKIQFSCEQKKSRRAVRHTCLSTLSKIRREEIKKNKKKLKKWSKCFEPRQSHNGEDGE